MLFQGSVFVERLRDSSHQRHKCRLVIVPELDKKVTHAHLLSVQQHIKSLFGKVAIFLVTSNEQATKPPWPE